MFGVLAAASLVFFAFIGFDVVATTAEETKNPKRDLPRGILGSLVIVTVLYVVVAARADRDGALHQLATAGRRAGDAGHGLRAVGVDWAATVIAIGALAGLTTVVWC